MIPNLAAESKSAAQDNLLIVQRWSWKTVLIVFSIYTVYVFVSLFQTYLSYIWRGTLSPEWIKDMEFTVIYCYTWALLTPALFIFNSHFSFTRDHLIRKILYQILFGIFIVSIHRLITLSSAYYLLNIDISMGETVTSRSSYILHHITDGLFTYIFIVAIYQALLYFRESQEREFRLQQAELQTLRMQLQPHFLFNTLNAISALIFIAPTRASKTIGELSDLLRLALSSGKTQEITLKEELDFLRKYILIQQTLLQERLEVIFSINSETLDSRIPNMILQPLVENSIKHGIAPKTEGGKIEISSWREGENLRINITDDGLGFNFTDVKNGTGIGLENTRMRMRYLYGDLQKIDFIEANSGGVTVSLSIPFRE